MEQILRSDLRGLRFKKLYTWGEQLEEGGYHTKGVVRDVNKGRSLL